MPNLLRLLFVIAVTASVCTFRVLTQNFQTSTTTPVDFGVGFNLSLDYATASIYFPNGSTIDVAKVEGSERYKQLMRGQYRVERGAAPIHSHSDYSAIPSQWKIISYPQQRLPFKQPLRTLWDWPWKDPTVPTMEYMIKALTVATEAYLELPVRAVDLVVPFPVPEIFHDQLRSACRNLWTRNSLPPHPPAVFLAAMANHVGLDCSDERLPLRVVLAVDYSRAALTMTLSTDECAVFDERRFFHDPLLGAAALRNCHDNGVEDECQNMLADAIRQFIKSPYEDIGYKVPDVVGALVMLGESARDARLSTVLRKVLKEQYDVQAEDISAVTYRGLVNPVFAASRGLAIVSWEHERWLN